MGTRNKTTQCHKCDYNGRTDEEANRACVKCSLLHIEKELKHAQGLDMSTCGEGFTHVDAAMDGDNMLGAKADALALRLMREPSGALTSFPPDVEDALFRFIHDIREMSEPVARAFYWLLNGYDITRTAAKLGVTKQAVSKNLLAFFKAHPNWRALMPTRTDPTTWRRKLHGVW